MVRDLARPGNRDARPAHHAPARWWSLSPSVQDVLTRADMLMPPSRIVTLPAALRDLKSGSVKARVLAADVLGDVTGDDRAAALAGLRAALDDDVAEVRAEAATSLGAQRDDGAVPGLIGRLDDGHPIVRQAAAIALGAIGDGRGFVPLAQALREGPADLRFQAATSLAEIDAAAAYDHLLRALDDPDAQVVAAVALALGATGDPRAPGHLARLLDRGAPAVRFDAAYALAQLHDRRGKDALEAALTDGARDWDAVCALEELGDPSAAPALAALLDRRRTAPPAQTRAAGAILAIDPGGPHAAAARGFLLRMLDHRKLDVRGLAVERLGAVAGGWARAPLERLRPTRKGRELDEAIATALAAIQARGEGGR
jgi:HEAT repeat protein